MIIKGAADFPCMDPAISSPRSFHRVKICSVDLKPKNSDNIIIRLCIGVTAHMLIGAKVNLGYASSFESRISLDS